MKHGNRFKKLADFEAVVGPITHEIIGDLHHAAKFIQEESPDFMFVKWEGWEHTRDPLATILLDPILSKMLSRPVISIAENWGIKKRNNDLKDIITDNPKDKLLMQMNRALEETLYRDAFLMIASEVEDHATLANYQDWFINWCISHPKFRQKQNALEEKADFIENTAALYKAAVLFFK